MSTFKNEVTHKVYLRPGDTIAVYIRKEDIEASGNFTDMILIENMENNYGSIAHYPDEDTVNLSYYFKPNG